MFKKKFNSVKASAIAEYIGSKLIGNDIIVQTFSSIDNPKENSLIFFTEEINTSFVLTENKILDLEKLKNIPNLLLLVSEKTDLKNYNIQHIISNNPRHDFEKAFNHFFIEEEFKSGIHKTSIIEKSAKIGSGCFIGPNCYVGEDVIIENNSKLLANVVIHGRAVIGQNCRIKSNSTIGGEGFSFSKVDKDMQHFCHTGQVVIENDVWIGSSVTIEKATIDKTLIKNGAKIDDLVHIGHNSIIGEYSQITVGSIVCGRAEIGNNCWLSPNSIIENAIKIGDHSLIGANTYVRKNVEKNVIVSGNPNRIIRRLKEI